LFKLKSGGQSQRLVRKRLRSSCSSTLKGTAISKSPRCSVRRKWLSASCCIEHGPDYARKSPSPWRDIMKPSNKELNELIDQATAEIRSERVDQNVVEGAAGRVWAKLSNEN